MNLSDGIAPVADKIKLRHCSMFKARLAFGEVLDLIGSVHHLGRNTLPITVRCRTNDSSLSSYFRIGRGFPVQNPIELQIWLIDHEPESDTHTRLLASLLHEIGHAVDFSYEANGLPLFKSQIDPLWNEWRETIMQSSHVAELTREAVSPPSYECEDDPTVQVQDLEYEVSVWRNLQLNELWARAYAQYIATKCNACDLLEHMFKIRDYEPLPGRPLPPNRQWDPGDFEQVAASMDSIFLRLGLLIE